MKVQIEIPKKVVNLAISIAQISQSASNDDDLTAIEQAVSRCNDEEVTEIDLSNDGDEGEFILMMLAMKAIAKRCKEIEKEKE